MTAQLALPGAPPPPKESLSQYDTPAWIAERMVEFAGIKPGMKVLEPSAGLGALALPAKRAGSDVMCCEIDPDRVDYLSDELGFPVVAGDFLTKTFSAFDLALTNPPYEDGQDLAHVAHALRFAPRVVALLPLGNLDGVERYERLWSKHSLAKLATLVRRFKSPGSDMSGQRPFGVFDIRRDEFCDVSRLEWWVK